MYKVVKQFEISCSHRLHDPILSEEINSEKYGKCNNWPSHGHNYVISVELSSDKLFGGMVMNFNDIKKVFKERIDDVYDHQFLNSCRGFEISVPTAENMARLFFDILKEEIPYLSKVTIQETEGAWASYEKD